ncbi:FAD-dependent monooxygenase [Gordonia sp. MP11Mi]|uniref:6-hydroxynicotinate 3-monooxygenase n=1 Tax=Gordonia sp. MP11Mi TaxID=3022769 RepID=A0AA97GUJ1_9ACTN
MTDNKCRSAIVVGGGIGGLTAALALRRRGIEVTVLEQAEELGEVGAGLQIGPNASSVLYDLGLADELNRIGLVVQESVRRRWQDGRILAKTTLGSTATRKYGAPYFHVHRADIHRITLDAAVDPNQPGPAAEVITGQRVSTIEDVDSESPTVVTVDGKRYTADVIIGADGIRSEVRTAIGGPSEIIQSGDMAYRALVPMDRLRTNSATSWFADWPAANFWLGHNRHLVAYPVRDMQFLNVIAIVPCSPQVADEWRIVAPAQEMRACFEGWDVRVTEMLAESDPEVMAWALNCQAPFADWSRGRVVLLGDACHAMLPYFSQGASEAIEDGAILAEELSDDVPARVGIDRYLARRAPHVERVQRGAGGNRDLFHLPDGPEQERRDARFLEQHQEADISFDFIYQGTPPRGHTQTVATTS